MYSIELLWVKYLAVTDGHLGRELMASLRVYFEW